jgi:hypothetical protein
MQSQSHAASRAGTSPGQPRTSAPRMVVVIAVAMIVASVATGVVYGSFAAAPNRAESANRGITSSAPTQVPGSTRPTRAQRAVTWLDGLASGMIIQSDVTGRLQQQDPELAHVVLAAWHAVQR